MSADLKSKALDIRVTVPATPEEAANVAAFVSQAFLSSPVFAGIDEERYSPKQISEGMVGQYVITIFLREKLVGSVTLSEPNPNSACETFRLFPTVGYIAVHPEHRRHGLVNVLLEHASQAAVKRGHLTLGLSVTTRGTKLVRIYQRQGFSISQTFQWPGVRDPSHIMVKALT